MDINLLGACDVVRIAHENGAKPVLFSSFAVKKTDKSLYGQTKSAMETYNKNDAVILRLSNVYGGENYLKAKSANLISHLARDDPIYLFNGAQTRDFVHVDKVVEWCIKAVNLAYGVYDVCSGTQTSLETLARIIGTVRNVPVVKVNQEEAT